MGSRSLKPKVGLEPSPRNIGLYLHLANRDRFTTERGLRLEVLMKENN